MKQGWWGRICSALALCVLMVAGCTSAEAALPDLPTATPIAPTAVASTATPVPPTATSVPPTETPVPPTATEVPPTPTPAPPTEVNGVPLRPFVDGDFLYGYPTEGLDQITNQVEADAVWTAIVVDGYTAAALGNPDHQSADFDEVNRLGFLHPLELEAIQQLVERETADGNRIVYGPDTEVFSVQLEYESPTRLRVRLCDYLVVARQSGAEVEPDDFTSIRTTLFGFPTPTTPQLVGFATDIVSSDRTDQCF